MLQQFYDADAAKKYNEMMPDEIPKIEVDLKLLADNVPPGDVLDVCCGTGDVLLWLSKNIDPSKYALKGIDISNDMLAVAKSKDSDNVLTLEQGNMQDLGSFQDGSCAAVLCNFSIHHLESPEKVVSETVRVLRSSGGVLYLSFWEGSGPMDNDDRPIQTYYHEQSKIEKILAGSGLTLLNTRSVAEEIYPGFSMNAAYIIAKKV
jgi:ubiquinone/menaquinone biosynthesis C-methylase UbiE